MRKIFETYRHRWSVSFSILLTVSLLLSGCSSRPDGQGQPQPTETTKTTEVPGAEQDTQTDKTAPDPGRNQGIDSSELAGVWERAWTEVEGDRNETLPGVCTIEITPTDTDAFRFTYTNIDFPEENISDRALTVVPGELYPDCGNDQWIGEVAEADEDIVCYTLTLLDDGVLLLQTYWEMDGMPMVSYGGFRQVG